MTKPFFGRVMRTSYNKVQSKKTKEGIPAQKSS